jgi:prevent-host-death family protein
MPFSLTIKQLHAKTGDWVRQAGKSRAPILITDRGEPVAVLASRAAFKSRRRKRILLPEYVALMKKKPGRDLLDDLSAVRDDR